MSKNNKDNGSQNKPNKYNKNELTKRWREFEYIVKEILTEILEKANIKIVKNILTPGQKDRGKDVDILIENESNDRIALTAEAKLRKGSELVLKDFASSILYFLFNDCNLHCIITNANFSLACREIYEIINTNKNIKSHKMLKYYDATALKNFLYNIDIDIDKRLCERLNKVDIKQTDKIKNSTLIETLRLLKTNICDNAAKGTPIDTQICSIITAINEFSKNNNETLKLDSDSEKYKDQALELLKKNSSSIIIINSQLDSLHNELVDSIIQNYRYGNIVELNLQRYNEFESLYLDLFSQIYGFNLSELFIKLHKNKIKITNYKKTLNDIPEYIFYILNDKKIASDDKKKFFYYLLKEKLGKTLIVFRNIQNGSPDIVKEIFNILKKIDSGRISVIIDYEQNNFYANENKELSSVLDDTIKNILEYRFNGQQTISFRLEDLKLNKARDYLCTLLPNREEEFYNTIIKQYGGNTYTLLELSKQIQDIFSIQELKQFILANSNNSIIEYNDNINKQIMSLFNLMQGHVNKPLMIEFIAQFFETKADNTLLSAIIEKANMIPEYSNCGELLKTKIKYKNCFAEVDRKFIGDFAINLIVENFNRKNSCKILTAEDEYIWYCPQRSVSVLNYFIVEMCAFLLKNVQFELLPKQNSECVKELIYHNFFINNNSSVLTYFADNADILNCFKTANLSRYLKAAESAMAICKKNMSDFLIIGILERCLNNIQNQPRYLLKNISYRFELMQLQQKYRQKNIKQLLDESDKLLAIIDDKNNKIKNNDREKLFVAISKFRYHLFGQILDYNQAFITIKKALEISPNDYILLHYQAICLKELHGYPKALKMYRKAIKLFLDNTQEKYFLNACYFVNYAADLVKTDIAKSIKLTDKAIADAKKLGDHELVLWVGGDKLYYELKWASVNKTKLTDDFYNRLNYYRRESDHNAYFTDLARSFNIEGIAFIYNGKFNRAATCFEKAFNFATSDTISFIQIMANTNYLLMCINNRLFPEHAWKYQINVLNQKKEFLNQKLSSRKNLKEETNYAVLVCTLYIAQIFNKKDEFENIVNLYNNFLSEFKFEKPIILKEYLIDSFFYNDIAAINF